MNNIPEYSFTRNSASPLEHKFGFVRCKSCDVHTLSKFIKIIATIQSIQKEKVFEDICSFNEDTNKIRGIINENVVCEPKKDDYMYNDDDDLKDDFQFSPLYVAKASLIKVGFFVGKSGFVNYDEAFDWVEFYLSQFTTEDSHTFKKKKQ